MTPEQIRATAIERVARAYADLESHPGEPNVRHLETAEHLVDALGDMLPTGLDWGTKDRGRAVVTRCHGEDVARDRIANGPGVRLMRQWVHEWTEVGD